MNRPIINKLSASIGTDKAEKAYELISKGFQNSNISFGKNDFTEATLKTASFLLYIHDNDPSLVDEALVNIESGMDTLGLIACGTSAWLTIKYEKLLGYVPENLIHPTLVQ